MKFVNWAVGVSVPEEFTAGQEDVVRRAYEKGVRDGKKQVTEPIIDALGIRDLLSD